MSDQEKDEPEGTPTEDQTTGPFSVSGEFAVPGSGSVSAPALVILSGEMTGVSHALGDGTTVMGREPECGVFLGDRTVSRHHAEIVSDGDGFILRDLGSLNGTYLNRRRIEGDESLHHGDEVQVGKFCLGFVGH